MIDIPTGVPQACMTAYDYLLHACKDINEVMGPGTAERNPELVAAYMHTAALNYLARAISTAIEARDD